MIGKISPLIATRRKNYSNNDNDDGDDTCSASDNNDTDSQE